MENRPPLGMYVPEKEAQMKDAINFDNITITDDVMFGSVFQEAGNCRELLQRILGIEIRELFIVESQKSIKIKMWGKGIRLDVYVKDIEGNSYDIELQLLDTKELDLRSRYYHSEMDSYQIRSGQKYKNLKESIVIFVCDFDLFELNRSIYTFETLCKEEKTLFLKDKRKTIFVNIHGDRTGIMEETADLLDFFKTGTPTDAFTEGLQKQVEEIRNNDEWRDNYMTLEMKLDQRFEDGEKIGMERGMKRGMERGMERGMKRGMETLTNVVLRLRKGESVEQLRKEGIEEEVIEKALIILE